MFLSQPGIVIAASYHWAPITVSIESAMRSRDWREYDIPGVPIEIPSDTPIVLKRMPTMPAAWTPLGARSQDRTEARVRRAMMRATERVSRRGEQTRPYVHALCFDTL
jgi:hypothetical protein